MKSIVFSGLLLFLAAVWIWASIGGPISEALLRIRVEQLLENGEASKPVEAP